MLEGAADGRVGETDGDGAEGVSIQLGMSLHDIEGTLRREGVVMAVDAGHNFTFLGIRVRCDGEMWAFDWGLDRFGGRCAREWDGRGVDKGDGGGCELWSYWVRGDGGLDVVEGGVCFSGGRHVVVVWKCWWR